MGPNISEIARRLGQYKESVRYRYKEKLLNKGFAVRVAVDHEKLGLRRVIMLMDFADGYRDVAELMLTIMSYEGYLVAFEKVLPDGRFLVHASVPDEKVEAYREFFGGLKEKGYFRSFEFHTFHWFRNAPMKTEMYDFDEGLWDFDWSTDAKVDRQAASYMPSAREKFDATDLKILKQLQMDGNRSLADMAESLKINYKTLTWHYRKHIEERKPHQGVCHQLDGHEVRLQGRQGAQQEAHLPGSVGPVLGPGPGKEDRRDVPAQQLPVHLVGGGGRQVRGRSSSSR